MSDIQMVQPGRSVGLFAQAANTMVNLQRQQSYMEETPVRRAQMGATLNLTQENLRHREYMTNEWINQRSNRDTIAANAVAADVIRNQNLMDDEDAEQKLVLAGDLLYQDPEFKKYLTRLQVVRQSPALTAKAQQGKAEDLMNLQANFNNPEWTSILTRLSAADPTTQSKLGWKFVNPLEMIQETMQSDQAMGDRMRQIETQSLLDSKKDNMVAQEEVRQTYSDLIERMRPATEGAKDAGFVIDYTKDDFFVKMKEKVGSARDYAHRKALKIPGPVRMFSETGAEVDNKALELVEKYLELGEVSVIRFGKNKKVKIEDLRRGDKLDLDRLGFTNVMGFGADQIGRLQKHSRVAEGILLSAAEAYRGMDSHVAGDSNSVIDYEAMLAGISGRNMSDDERASTDMMKQTLMEYHAVTEDLEELSEAENLINRNLGIPAGEDSNFGIN